MTIADKFLEKEKKEKEQQDQIRLNYAKNLGLRLNEALLDIHFIQKVTPLLEQYGAVQFSDVGCLCQEGCCSAKKGFPTYCQEAIDFWNKEGVHVKLGISSGLSVKPNPDFLFRSYPNVTVYSNN